MGELKTFRLVCDLVGGKRTLWKVINMEWGEPLSTNSLQRITGKTKYEQKK